MCENGPNFGGEGHIFLSIHDLFQALTIQLRNSPSHVQRGDIDFSNHGMGHIFPPFIVCFRLSQSH